MADAGMDDILIVYPLWGERKWKRLVDLAGRARVTVAVDSLASRQRHFPSREGGRQRDWNQGGIRCWIRPLRMANRGRVDGRYRKDDCVSWPTMGPPLGVCIHQGQRHEI